MQVLNFKPRITKPIHCGERSPNSKTKSQSRISFTATMIWCSSASIVILKRFFFNDRSNSHLKVSLPHTLLFLIYADFDCEGDSATIHSTNFPPYLLRYPWISTWKPLFACWIAICIWTAVLYSPVQDIKRKILSLGTRESTHRELSSDLMDER